MSKTNPNSNGGPAGSAREELIALLEKYNYSPATFDGLYANSYEKVLASHSLDSLDLAYSLLLQPVGLEKVQPDMPQWPKGHKLAGKPPGINTMAEIKQRLRTEQTLNGLSQINKFVEKLRTRAAQLPAGEQSQVLDSVITLAGEELLQAKLAGGSVAANLDIVDRLLKANTAKTKAQQEEVKISIRTKAEERQSRKLQLEINKYLDLAAEKILDSTLRKKADEINASGLSQADKIKAMRKAAFSDVDALQQSGKIVIPKS